MNPFFNHILSILLLTPIAGAVVILLVPRHRIRVIRRVAGTCAGAAFLLSLPLWFLYEPHGKTWQFAERVQWMASAGASYYIGLDGFSMLLVLLTTVMGVSATVASRDAVQDRTKEFYVSLLVLQTGMLGAFMALDFLLFFVCWQLMLAPMYFLIRIWGHGSCRESARKFLLYGAAGSAAILAGILILGFYSKAATGVYSFDITRFHVVDVPLRVQAWVFLAFLFGFAAAAPLTPLHGWLPDAQTEAPTAASMMLGAVALNMGPYGFIRFSVPILPDASRYFVPLIAALALSSIVYGAYRAVKACVQTDWKRLIAYASLSHTGMVMLALFAFTPPSMTGAAVLLLTRGVCTGALLLLACILYERGRARQPVAGRGLARAMPVFAAILVLLVPLATVASSVAGYPAPLLRQLETSVGRAVVRVDPAYGPIVAQGSDCPTPAAADPKGPPSIFVLTESCADGSAGAPKPAEQPDDRR